MSNATAWQRSAFQSGGFTNQFSLFCFSTTLSSDVPMSASRFGLPSPDAMKHVEVRELTREMDSAWFDGFRSGSLRNVASQWLAGDLSSLDTATQLTAVLVSREDAADLVHLQAGWAVAKWLIARGASVVLDAQTNRFWKAADVADWPAVRDALPLGSLPTLTQIDGEGIDVAVQAIVPRPVGWPELEAMSRAGARQMLVLPVERMLA